MLLMEPFEKIKLKEVVSYSTRPKRENETNGKEHWFITSEEAKDIISKSNILAYTKIGETGYEYFATLESITQDNCNCYIIDPKGYEYLKDKFPDLNIVVFYISASYKTRLDRCKERSDFLEAFEKRNIDEQEEFFTFAIKYSEKKYEDENIYFIDNDGKIEDSINKIINFILNKKLYGNNELYLFIGRTGSGKDSIVKRLKEIFN